MPNDGELIDAKIAAAEARSETKIAHIEGKLDTILATISGKFDASHDLATRDHEYNRNTRWILAGLIIAAFGIFIAVLSYGNERFSSGMSVRDIVQTVIKEQQQQKGPPSNQVAPLQR